MRRLRLTCLERCVRPMSVGSLCLVVCLRLSASSCLPPAVCLRLSAVQWIVVASFQCQCLQLLMVLPVIQCCLQCSQFLGRKQKTESTKMVTTITITTFLHYILYILIKLRTKKYFFLVFTIYFSQSYSFLALETRSSTLSLLFRKKNYRTKNKIIYFWCLLRLDLLAHFPLDLGFLINKQTKMNIFNYSFLSFEASSSSSLPTLLGFFMNKQTKMNIFHYSFLSFENNQPFLASKDFNILQPSKHKICLEQSQAGQCNFRIVSIILRANQGVATKTLF